MVTRDSSELAVPGVIASLARGGGPVTGGRVVTPRGRTISRRTRCLHWRCWR